MLANIGDLSDFASTYLRFQTGAKLTNEKWDSQSFGILVPNSNTQLMEFAAFLVTFLCGFTFSTNELVHLAAISMGTERVVRGANLATWRLGVTYRSNQFQDLSTEYRFTEGNDVWEHNRFKVHNAFI